MTTFQDRERAFEAKYAHDEEFRFLVGARRDKLLAEWAADRLRLLGQAKSDLTASVLAVRDGAGHDERLFRHLTETFLEHGSSVPDAEVSAALTRYAIIARQQLLDTPTRG